MRLKICAIIFVALTLLMLSQTAEADGEHMDMMLIDLGNGESHWAEVEPGTYSDVVLEASSSLELNANFSGGLSIQGLRHRAQPIDVDWRIYVWDDGWRLDGSLSMSSTYLGGIVAVGYYPDNGVTPVATPDEPNVWTTMAGSSSAYSQATSAGTDYPANPVEWFRTYSTGYVDSGLIVADQYLYHTTGGDYVGSGINHNPWIYCINRYTGDVVWSHMMNAGAGYEVTTPLVVGDMLIVTCTEGKVLCLDRYLGTLLYTQDVPFNPPLDSEGNVTWEGRIFVSGGTTPVYDSGAIYFGTADGKVHCYTISRDSGFKRIWTYVPPPGYIGSFYYHAPTIATVDGARTLFIGSYEGYVHALDISDGDPLWARQVVNYSSNNTPEPGTPGSAATISVSRDGSILLIGCTDGGMIASDGYTLALNASTGEGLNGDGEMWRINALLSSPVVSEDGFYSYVSRSAKGSRTLTTVEGVEVGILGSICKFDWNGRLVWQSAPYPLMKGSLTLADGVLYGMDYSAGRFWPTGGGLTAVDANDGSEVWRILLQPCTVNSYSMVQPTVIDGKIYAANDLGAVYCVSVIAGPSIDGSAEMPIRNAGFMHWSWAVVAGMFITALFLLIRFY